MCSILQGHIKINCTLQYSQVDNLINKKLSVTQSEPYQLYMIIPTCIDNGKNYLLWCCDTIRHFTEC